MTIYGQTCKTNDKETRRSFTPLTSPLSRSLVGGVEVHAALTKVFYFITPSSSGRDLFSSYLDQYSVSLFHPLLAPLNPPANVIILIMRTIFMFAILFLFSLVEMIIFSVNLAPSASLVCAIEKKREKRGKKGDGRGEE